MSNFLYVSTIASYTQACYQVARSTRSAADTETYTKAEYNTQQYKASDLRTNPHTGACSLMSLMTDDRQLYVFDFIVLESLRYDPSLLLSALKANEYLLFHNAKFDVAMLSNQLGWLDNTRCTYILAQMYANATGSKLWQTRGMSLGALCRDWLGVSLVGKGTTQISEWYSDPSSRTLDNPTWVTKLEYAASDVKYLFDLYDLLIKLTTLPMPETQLVKDNCATVGPYGLGMGTAVTLELMLIPIVAQMEVAGLPFSPVVTSKFKAAIDARVVSCATYLCEQLKLPLITDGLWGDPIPDPSSQKVLNNPVKLLNAVVESTGLKLTTSQAAIFRRCADILGAMAIAETDGTDLEIVAIDSEVDLFEEIDALSLSAKSHGLELLTVAIEYKKMIKQQGMLLTKYVNPATKRIHPSFSPLRASTSRFACSRPNVQQLPARLDLALEFTLDELRVLVDLVQ